MLTIFICDDEPAVLQQIHHYITGYYINHPGEYIVRLFESGTELFQAAKERTADVIFLDIDLADSNGIKIAKVIRQFDKQVKIVFITNHKNYKGLAFSVRAFGYVDKPVTAEQISTQLSDIETYLREEAGTAVHTFDTTDGIMHIPLHDILYFTNENRKTKLVTFQTVYYIRQKLSTLAKQLPADHFISPHVSFLVNLSYVNDCCNYIVYMIDGQEIPLSQRRSPAFRKALDHFLIHSVAPGRRT